jgi:hypothetical protein
MSDYVRKAQDFNKVVVATDGNNWIVRGLDYLKELRIPDEMGFPDLTSSTNVAGFNDYQGMRYVHVVGNQVKLALSSSAPTQPYLVDANAKIDQFERTSSGFQFKLAGHVPLDFTINASHCQVISHEGLSHVATTATSNQQYRSRHAAATVEAVCRP